MDWIKKNPHLLALILIAVGAVAASGLLVMNASGFNEKFQAIQQPVLKGTKIFEQEKQSIEQAQAEFQKPAAWAPTAENGPIFVSNIYVIENDRPVTPAIGELWKDSLLKKGIPNSWFLNNKLPLFTQGVALQDPDGDGFSNEEEFRGNTNPNDKASHPPYYALLFVKQFIRVPFLLKFQSADYDPKHPEEATFGINPLTLRKPTQFLKIGDPVAGTKFKLEKYEEKKTTDANGIEKDVSELTLLDTEFNTTITLVKGQVTDSPDSYANFSYLWPKPGIEIKVKKLQQFILKPEAEQRYKLLDINAEGAQIQTPSGDKVTIPNLPPP